ncbi:MAG: hypothetical protein ABH833_04685 [Parcubacteria group bacterium]
MNTEASGDFINGHKLIRKEAILESLQSTSSEIAEKFDKMYSDDLSILAQELSVSYSILHKVINKENPQLPDNDFQSALLYWKALNSIIAAMELLRRGYRNETQELMRNLLEVFAVAYDFHKNPSRYKEFINNPKRFKTKHSIATIKKVHPFIGMTYGMLSESFTHVSALHVVPHEIDDGLCVGGMFDPKNQAIVKINLLSIIGTLDILNSVLELTFLKHIQTPRFWIAIDTDNYKYTPNNERSQRVMDEMKKAIDSLKE